MSRNKIAMVASAPVVGSHNQKPHPRWHIGRVPAVLAMSGIVLAGLFSGGCPEEPKAPKVLQSRVKAAGQTINVPNRPPQPAATVAIIRDNTVDYSAMVSQALEAALGPGGIGNLVHSGNTVLIKPNMVTNKAAAVTDWHVVKALVDLIQAVNGGAAITIADGSAAQDTISIMTANGFTAANFPGVTFANFNDTTTNPTNTYVLADARTGASEQIPALITDADVYIDLPKMKTHLHAGYTGALKNLGIGTGPLPVWNQGTGGSAKWGLHHDIRSEIVDHVACRVPDLSIMDAIQGMEGQGPASGSSVTMNMVLASKDPVALDAVACTIMGIPPALIAHMVLAANENLGVIDLSNITTTGNISLAAASAIHPFVRATAGALQGPTDPGNIPYRATTVVRPAPAAMTIDGDLSEFGYANAMVANASYQVKASSSTWGGAADSSFTAQALYDSNNLYLAVAVKDDVKLVNSNTGAAIVNGDGVELYLSTYTEQYSTGRSASYGSTYDYPGHQLRRGTAVVHGLAQSGADRRRHHQGRHGRWLRPRGDDPLEQFRRPIRGANGDCRRIHRIPANGHERGLKRCRHQRLDGRPQTHLEQRHGQRH